MPAKKGGYNQNQLMLLDIIEFISLVFVRYSHYWFRKMFVKCIYRCAACSARRALVSMNREPRTILR